MNTAGPELYKIRALRRASRCSDATISQIALDIRRAREALEATKPKRGRKERDYLGDFNPCFPDFAPAETYEQLFFRIAILSGLLGSDAKAYEYVAAQHPSGKSRSEEHTSELQSLMRISYAVFCLKKNTTTNNQQSLSQ